MGRRPKLPKCFDARSECFARTNNGECFCLESTFPNKECPFYKREGEVKRLVTARDYKEAKNNERDPLEAAD